VAGGRRRTPNLTHRVNSGSHSIVAPVRWQRSTNTIGAILHFQTLDIPIDHIPSLYVLKPVKMVIMDGGAFMVCSIVFVSACDMFSLHYSVFTVTLHTLVCCRSNTLQIYLFFFKNLVFCIFIIFI